MRNVIARRRSTPFRARAANGARLQLVAQPHASCIGADERAARGHARDGRARSRSSSARSVTPPVRVARLCAFLEAVGALCVESELSLASAYALLELGDGANAEEIKRAYRRLARALHPDVHPNASPDELRELERRFAAVSAAYRRFV